MSRVSVVKIRDTEKDGATRCIMGRSTCGPKFTVFVWESDCKQFYSEQFMDSNLNVGQKIVLTQFELRDLVVLQSI